MRTIERILRNVARCRACGDVVESTHRRHFVKCRCGELFVDGGTDYLRRGWGAAGFDELSEFETQLEKPG